MSIRPPVPKNKILLFTLVGAILTGAVAVGLAYPGFSSAGDDGNTQAAEGGIDTPADTPEPNENFTPEVADSGYEEHEEHEEHEEYHEGDDGEYEENEEEDDEYEDEYEDDRYEEQDEYETDEYD